MKALILLISASIFTGCMMLPQPPAQASRRLPPVISDLDNLEMLLQNEQTNNYEDSYQMIGIDSLRLGMNKNNVQEYLGRPSLVEIAGNPKYGYERWTYEQSVPTLRGYMKEKKVIYFENGQVVGWESK